MNVLAKAGIRIYLKANGPHTVKLVLTIDGAFVTALPLDRNCWKYPAYLEQQKMLLEEAYRSQIEAKKEEHAIYIEGVPSSLNGKCR